jgi:hypothetical protein
MIKKIDIDYDSPCRLRQEYGQKINELCDVINTIQKEREAEWFEIKEWIGILEAVRKSVNIHEKQIDELQMKFEPEKCKTHAENVPELTHLQKENNYIKDNLERITDILYESKYALEEVINPSFISHEQEMAKEALDKVNAEIKAITGE